MFDFGRVTNDTTTTGHNQVSKTPGIQHCSVYAIVKETKSQKSSTVCGGASSLVREKNIYLSEGNEIEVRMMSSRRTKDGGQFLIKYEGRTLNCKKSNSIQFSFERIKKVYPHTI